MIFIDIEDLDGRLPVGWADKAEKALLAVRNATPAERSKVIAKHSDVWSDLKEALKDLSHAKCWYCESKNLRSDNAVDHYRPKGNVKGSNPPHDGYWWLAFEWRNYRFCCTLCNSIRNSPTTSGGKQDYFPIENEGDRIRLEGGDLSDELPLLLDPARSLDPVLFWFDEDGSVAPQPPDKTSREWQRANESLTRYHLNHPDARDARVALFVQLRRWLREADEALNRAGQKRPNAYQQADLRIRDLRRATLPTGEFSAAAKCFIKSMAQKSQAARTVLALFQ